MSIPFCEVLLCDHRKIKLWNFTSDYAIQTYFRGTHALQMFGIRYDDHIEALEAAAKEDMISRYMFGSKIKVTWNPNCSPFLPA